MNGKELHELLGAYLLGGLDAADRPRFEEHLEHCGSAAKNSMIWRPCPALLDAVPVPDAVALAVPAPAGRGRPRRSRSQRPAAAVLDELAARRRNARRRWTARVGGRGCRRPRRGICGRRRCSIPPPNPMPATPSRPSNGLQVTVGLVKKTWGTELAVDGRSLPVEGTFSLWVKDRDGGEDRACAWTATPSGRAGSPARPRCSTPASRAWRCGTGSSRPWPSSPCRRVAAPARGLTRLHSWCGSYILASLARTTMKTP